MNYMPILNNKYLMRVILPKMYNKSFKSCLVTVSSNDMPIFQIKNIINYKFLIILLFN